MQENKVKFTIGQAGGIKLEVIDGQGESCMAVTEELELHLSSVGEKTDGGKKPEFYDGDGPSSVFHDQF